MLNRDGRQMKRQLIGITVLAAILTMSSAWAIDLPKGWRVPSAKELSDVERKDSPRKYARVTVDLNGDGVPDEAFLLKRVRSSREALWVYLSNSPSSWMWTKLDEI